MGPRHAGAGAGALRRCLGRLRVSPRANSAPSSAQPASWSNWRWPRWRWRSGSTASPAWCATWRFAVMFIGSVSTLLFNGNPLLRFDAYYVLCDLLDLPNLAPRSNACWSTLLRRHLLRDRAEAPQMAAGEAKWLALYAPLSFAYRLALSLSIVLWLGGKWLFLGLFAAAYLVLSLLLRPLLGWARQALASAAPGRELNRVRAALARAGAGRRAAAVRAAAAVHHGRTGRRLAARAGAGAPGGRRLHRRTAGDGRRAGRSRPGAGACSTIRISLTARQRIAEPPRRPARRPVPGDAARPGRGAEPGRRHRPQRSRTGARRTAHRPVAGARQRGGTARHAAAVRSARRPCPPGRGARLRARPRRGCGCAPRWPRKMPTWCATAPAAPRFAWPTRPAWRWPPRSRRMCRRPPASCRRPALGDRAGGPYVTDPADKDGTRSLDPVFLFDLTLPGSALERVGQRAWVRFDHGSQPLAVQLYRRACSSSSSTSTRRS